MGGVGITDIPDSRTRRPAAPEVLVSYEIGKTTNYTEHGNVLPHSKTYKTHCLFLKKE